MVARTLALLFVCSTAIADVTVNETTITGDMHGAVARFSAIYPAANNLVVKSGVVTLPSPFDFDAIEVQSGATLKLSRTADTTGRVKVLTILPGGSLDFGSETDPVLRKVDIQIADSPLLCGTDGALGPDAEQFGAGILNFGEWKAYGRKVQPVWTTMQPTQAGATQIALSESHNWQVGDELLFFDTAKMQQIFDAANGKWLPPLPPRRETAKIAAIQGQTVTLDSPLKCDHAAYLDDKGQLLQLPPVANITRNIVIRSENPQGTRGHTMFMDTAHVNLYYTSFLGLGRTLPKPLDNLDTHTGHIGENQVARYAVHWHHVHGHADAQDYTGRLVGCYLDGDGIAKWGSVQHGTHDLLIADNIGERFSAAFVTEDGYEVRGRYDRDLAAYCTGNGTTGKFNVLSVAQGGINAPGSEGAGYWFHGVKHTVIDCMAINNAIGFQDLLMNQVQGRLVPSVPGGMPDTPYTNDPDSLPMVSQGNKALSNTRNGIEQWHNPPGRLLSACDSLYNAGSGFDNGDSEANNMLLRDCRSISNSAGITCSAGYTASLDVEGGEITGNGIGAKDSRSTRLKNVLFRNGDNLRWDDFLHLESPAVLDHVTFEKLTPATRHLVLGKGGNEPFFSDQFPTDEQVRNRLGDLFKVLSWNGDGKEYRLYENFVAPPGAIQLPGLVNAKAVLVGTMPDPPPVDPPPVEPPPMPDKLQQLLDELKTLVEKYSKG